MTSGARASARADTRRRRLVVAALAPFAAGSGAPRLAPLLAASFALLAKPARPQTSAQDVTFGLAALMTLLARRKSGEARFTEERFVRGFDSPLRSSGVLAFTAPDRFTRRTLEPRPESMVVAGNMLELERGGRKRFTTLDTLPEVAALADAMRATLGGDGALLRKHFDVRVSGSAALWTLTLEPRERELASQVRSVQLAGQGGDLRSVELVLAGGDRSLMLIEPLPGAAAAGAASSTLRPAVGR